MRILFFFFVIMPIAEIMLLIKVGDHIGGLNTVGLVILTAIIGATLLRIEGLDTLLKANQKMAQGQMPIKEILSGIMLAVGGALLLTPGFITDGIGFICLLPLSRSWVVASLLRKGLLGATGFGHSSSRAHQSRSPFGSGMGEGAANQPGSSSSRGSTSFSRDSSSPSTTTIDGEYKRED